jgi:hypothetical protein
MQFDSVVDDALDYYARTVVTMLYLEVTASIAVDWQSFDVSCRVFLVEGCLSQSIALEVSNCPDLNLAEKVHAARDLYACDRINPGVHHAPALRGRHGTLQTIVESFEIVSTFPRRF